MTAPPETNTTARCSWTLALARLLLTVYALALTFEGKAGLQSITLLTAFALLLWERRTVWPTTRDDAFWLLGPLLVFSAWIILACGFWQDIFTRPWDPSFERIVQPWFSLDQWRRDIGQPMVGLVCAYWAFRDVEARRRLFLVQAAFVGPLLVKCLWQFHHGEVVMCPMGWVTMLGTNQVHGFAHDNIFFSYVLLLLTPAVLWLVLERRPGWRGWMRWAVFLILMYLIFLNKRRGTWTAVFVEFLIIAWWLGRRQCLAYVVAALLVGSVAFHFRPGWFQRDYDKDNTGRVQIYMDVAELIPEHPFVGVGFGKDTVVKRYWHSMYQQSHNTFANLALETGFPGLAWWVFAMGMYAARFWRARAEGWDARIGFALLIAFCLRNLTDDVWVASIAELFWFTLGVLMPTRKTK